MFKKFARQSRMRPFYLRIIHPPLWIYGTLSCAILIGLWSANTLLHQISDLPPATSQSPFSLTDVGLPGNGWLPVSFSDLTRTRATDVVYKQRNLSHFSIYRFSRSTGQYYKVQSFIIPSTTVSAVFPVDFLHRGTNDFLVAHSVNGRPPYSLSVLRNEAGFVDMNMLHLNVSSLGPPFVFDFLQNGGFDILFIDAASGIPRFLYGGDAPMDNFTSVAAAMLDENSKKIDIVAVTEAGATRSVIEVFSQGNAKWVRKQRFLAPPNIGKIALADFDGDGFVDIVFPVFPEKKSSYLCFMFNGPRGFTSDVKCSNKTSSIRHDVKNILYDAQPLIGDITLSGIPDVSISVIADGAEATQLILNQPCKTCSTREIMLVDHNAIPGVGGFFDIKEKGKLDILTSSGAFMSSLADDSLFLKVSALNGLCLDACSKKPRYPNPPPLATIYNGATMKVEFTDKSGGKHKAMGVQRATNGLTLPYYIFGLGENVHYVQELSVTTEKSDTWTWILPSSAVFTSSNHQIRVFLMYKIQWFYVFFGVTALLLLLGMIILYYARKEDEEDKKEAEEMLPLF